MIYTSQKQSRLRFDVIAAEAGVRPEAFLLPALLSMAAALFELLAGVLLVPSLQAGILLRFDDLREAGAVRHLESVLFLSSKPGDKALFVAVLAVIAGATMLKTFLMHEAAVIFSKRAHRITGELRRKLFSAALAADKRLFDKVNIGHLQNVLLGQVQRISSQAIMAHESISHFFLFLAYSAVMAWISWKLTILAGFMLPLIHFSGGALGAKIRAASRDGAVAQKRLSVQISGALANSALVRAEASQELEVRRLDSLAETADRLQAQIDVQSWLTPKIQESVFILMMVVLLFGLGLSLRPEEPSLIPSLLVFVYVARRASICAMSISRIRTAVAAVEGSLQDASDLLMMSAEYSTLEGKTDFPGLKRGISVKNLTCRFEGGEFAISELSLRVSKGETLAVVGPSGSGKTTLLNVLMRHYAPPVEAVFLDDVDIRTFTSRSLAAAFAVVPQNPTFFDDTLRANLSYPNSGFHAEERLRTALRNAGLLEFVARQPQGLDTRIGEGGLRLSGGERQRLAIARAFLKGADILLFDEATSALDSETEAIIQNSLANAPAGTTAIIVAHRLATVQHADRILVLDKGRLVEEGCFEALKSLNGTFKRMLDAQEFA